MIWPLVGSGSVVLWCAQRACVSYFRRRSKPLEGGTMRRVLMWALLLGIGALVAAEMKDIRRYIRIRRM